MPTDTLQSSGDGQGQSKAQLDEFVAHVVSQNFHPVVIFGGSGSGKTAMIMSLLRLLSSRPTGVGMTLDASFFPPQYPEREERIKSSYDYLQILLQNFRKGSIAKSLFVRPLFLPLMLTTDRPIKEFRDHIRIVLIDAQGEWYETNASKRGSDGSWTPDFEPELCALIGSEHVTSMTTMFVAPHSVAADGSKPADLVTDGLTSTIHKYRNERHDESGDWNIFLFTKWDRVSKARRQENLWNPDLEQLDEELQHRSREAWTAYYNGNTISHDRRCFMQYVSMIGDIALPAASSKHAVILDHYGRILLNWIYANASEATCGVRVSLFPDVDVYRDEKMPFYDRVLGWIAGARV